jgi:hypothetical protein
LSSGLEQLLRDEKVTNGDRHQGNCQVRQKHTNAREIVANTTKLAQSAVLHVKHLLSGWRDGSAKRAGSGGEIRYPTVY